MICENDRSEEPAGTIKELAARRKPGQSRFLDRNKSDVKTAGWNRAVGFLRQSEEPPVAGLAVGVVVDVLEDVLELSVDVVVVLVDPEEDFFWYPSEYQPPPFSWNDGALMSLVTLALQVGHFLRTGSLMD